MQTTTIIARDSRAALDEIARQLGPDALILETRRHPRGVEMVAALERLAPLRPARPAPLPIDEAFQSFADQAAAIGIDQPLIARIDATDLNDATEAWSRFLALIDAEIAIAPPPHLDARHICVVGGSGTGKTTVLAQIAARLRRDDPNAPIAFLSADSQRLGAREQLRLIGGKLGIPVLEAGEGGAAISIGRRLLVDMPSDPYTARRVAETMADLPGGLTTLCTLPLTAQRARHRQMLDHFAEVTDAFVVTHAGESLPPGALISALAGSAFPLAYLSRDADPLGLIEAARPTALYRLIVAALSGASPVLH